MDNHERAQKAAGLLVKLTGQAWTLHTEGDATTLISTGKLNDKQQRALTVLNRQDAVRWQARADGHGEVLSFDLGKLTELAGHLQYHEAPAPTGPIEVLNRDEVLAQLSRSDRPNQRNSQQLGM